MQISRRIRDIIGIDRRGPAASTIGKHCHIGDIHHTRIGGSTAESNTDRVGWDAVGVELQRMNQVGVGGYPQRLQQDESSGV